MSPELTSLLESFYPGKIDNITTREPQMLSDLQPIIKLCCTVNKPNHNPVIASIYSATLNLNDHKMFSSLCDPLSSVKPESKCNA